MPEITHVGTADEVSFVKADFGRHGVDDQGAVHFDAKNNKTAEVSEAAWAWLSDPANGFDKVFRLTSDIEAEKTKVVAVDTEASEEDGAEAPPADATPTATGTTGRRGRASGSTVT